MLCDDCELDIELDEMSKWDNFDKKKHEIVWKTNKCEKCKSEIKYPIIVER